MSEYILTLTPGFMLCQIFAGRSLRRDGDISGLTRPPVVSGGDQVKEAVTRVMKMGEVRAGGGALGDGLREGL